MEINYLREFVVLARTGNFLEAADTLYIAQSTLSKHIRKMETELGVPLFDRTTRKVSISKFGELLLPYAEQVVEIQDQYTAALQNGLAIDREYLILGSIPALAQYNITEAMVDFKQRYPQSTLDVVQGGSEELREMLRQGKCELAFIRDMDDRVDADLVKMPYTVDTMVAVLPATHPLAKQKTLPLHMLANESFLLIEKHTMPYELSISACKRSGFEPRVVYTDHRLENLFDLVSKGIGVALLMKQLTLHIDNPGISVVDVSPSVSTQINLCYLKGVELSTAAQHFVLCMESR